MVRDPITGIDPADTILTAYQIPLASQPVLAPEWKPKGKYGSVLHPDNIPTVFATAQAHNNVKPGTAQALSTDGKKNLNVNIAAGAAGGLSNASVFSHVWAQDENSIDLTAASPAFTPTQGIIGVQMDVVGAAQDNEWAPQYYNLHIGPNGDATDPIFMTLSPFHENVGGNASPQFRGDHGELSFSGYVNQAGAWAGVALKVFIEFVLPGFGWCDGASVVVFYA